MAIDTPARIAVIGAGPIGLEVALYGRFLGYDVDVYERGNVAEHVRAWGHVRMFSPFGMNASPLGIAALRAQDANWRPPAPESLHTGGEFLERYLLPLAASDLLDGHIYERTTVLAVGKTDSLKGELVGDEDRGDEDFRLLVRDSDGSERFAEADAVVDATGVFGNPNWMGPAGISAVGEHALRNRIVYGLPDFAAARDRFAGKHTLVVGAGYSAATNIAGLAAVAAADERTHVIWITRGKQSYADPISRIVGAPLAERDRIARLANEAAHNKSVTWLPDSSVLAIAWDAADEVFRVRISGATETELAVSNVLANVGFRPDASTYSELVLAMSAATEGPARLAEALRAKGDADCLLQPSCGAASLLTGEPNFYILGAKSYGRNGRFLLLNGLRQVRDLFTIIGDREELDLYRSIGQAEL